MKSAPDVVMNADVGGSHIIAKLVYNNQQQLIREASINKDCEHFNFTILGLTIGHKGILMVKNVAQFNTVFCLNAKRMTLSYLEEIKYNKPNYKPN